MFTWICPKCGKEVPPSYSECPNCAKPAEATPPPLPAASPQPLPGPLPAAQVVAAPRPVQRSGRVSVPVWVVTILLATALIIIGFTVIVIRNATRSASTQASVSAPLENPLPAVAASQTNPAFKNVELTGLRFTEDAKQKAFIQLVAVNHSSADLGEISARISLKAAANKSKEPVGTFELKTTLGPYESKEIKAPVETKLRVYELPDWQFLRAEVAAQ